MGPSHEITEPVIEESSSRQTTSCISLQIESLNV